jgi:uncharacterized membrane protein
MIDDLVFALTLAAALGCGLIAGVFFAFSSFVMAALARRPSHEAIAAMQSINLVVLNPWFLGVFLGTGALCAGISILALTRWQAAGSGWLALGGLLYLAGTFGVTMVCNVPRNDLLASVEPTSAEGAATWERYRAEWTRWNHVRTAAALGALAAFCVALAR